MILPDKWFDFLKWLDMLALPAIATAYAALSAVWGFPFAEEIPKTIMIVCALLGTFLGISNVNYYQKTPLEMPENEEVVDNNIHDREG